MRKLAYLLFFTLILFSCNNSNKKSSNDRKLNYNEEANDYDEYEEEVYYEESKGFEDGTYTANIDYYNPETGYSASYTLEVEVEDNQVTIIYFPNDGYLDDDHIWPDGLDDEGFVSIEGENGKTYDIQIDY